MDRYFIFIVIVRVYSAASRRGSYKRIRRVSRAEFEASQFEVRHSFENSDRENERRIYVHGQHLSGERFQEIENDRLR